MEPNIIKLAKDFKKMQKIRVAFGNAVDRAKKSGFDEIFYARLEKQTTEIERVEKDMRRALEIASRDNPFFAWCSKRHDGLTPYSVSMIYGLCGGLERFPMVSSLWHYFGFHVIDGRAPKQATPTGLGSFSNVGRAFVRTLAEAAIRSGSKKQTAYRKLYDKERAKTLGRERAGTSACPFGVNHTTSRELTEYASKKGIKTDRIRTVQCVKVDKDGKEVSAHVHNHCLRIVAKKILMDVLVDFWDFKKDVHAR